MDGNKIESINVKMINHPSAPKKKFGREEMEVYRDFEPKSDKAAALGSPSEVSGISVDRLPGGDRRAICTNSN